MTKQNKSIFYKKGYTDDRKETDACASKKKVDLYEKESLMDLSLLMVIFHLHHQAPAEYDKDS